MTRVLVLRPEPGATATLARARQIGLDAIAIPLFEIEPVGWEAPDIAAFDGLLLTSANALRHGGPKLQLLRSLAVYAVGSATADAAREAGFNVVATGDSGVNGLLAPLEPNLRLIHISGEDRKSPASGHTTITCIPAYRARENEVDLSGMTDAVALIHSPRAGARFAKLVSATQRGGISIAAISVQALTAAGRGWAAAEAVEHPNEEALLALAARLCNKTAAQ